MTISRLDYSKNSGPFHTVSFHRRWTFSNNFQSAKFSREGQCGRIGGPPSSTAEPTSKLRVEMAGIPAPLIALFSTDETKFQSPEKLLQGLGGKRSRIRPHRWVNRTERIESLLVVAFIPDSLENCTRRGTRRDASAGGFDHPVITVPCQDKYAVSKFWRATAPMFELHFQLRPSSWPRPSVSPAGCSTRRPYPSCQLSIRSFEIRSFRVDFNFSLSLSLSLSRRWIIFYYLYRSISVGRREDISNSLDLRDCVGLG